MVMKVAKKHESYCKSKDLMRLSVIRKKNPELSAQEINDLHTKRLKSVGLTKDAFVKKHGTDKFLDCMKTRVRGRSNVSKWSLDIINLIIKEQLDNTQILETRYGQGKEICIHDIENKRSYYYDLYIKTKNRKLIIEFNGQKFHADCNLSLEEKEKWKNPFRPDLKWEDSFKYDKRKLEVAKIADYEILVVWDYENREQILKKIKDFIYGN